MEHPEGDDEGSTILIESGSESEHSVDLYDSDGDDSSGAENGVDEVLLVSLTSRLGEESSLTPPQPGTSIQQQPVDSAPIRPIDDRPGPSGLSNIQEQIQGVETGRSQNSTIDQSAQRDGYVNEGRALTQVNNGLERSRQHRAANQGRVDGGEEEPMDTGGVANEVESSNDSMNDFQELRKPAGAAADDSSSDDESQSCIICYETWTTSGSHRLVSLRCGHLFGQSCIEQWLKGQGGKCPQCNSKAKKSDVRVIYAKALKALDTSERDRAMKELEKEKELRKKAEMDAAQTQLRYVMAMEEVKRMKAVLEAHQKSAARNHFGGAGSSSGHVIGDHQSSGHYILDRSISVSANGNCRVLAFDAANSILLASMPSPNVLFQGYGLKKISAMDFKTSQYVPIHSKPIRGLAFNERNDGLVLSASVDKQLKITSLSSSTVVQTYSCAMPAWCCAWNSANTNYVYAGLQNGAVVIFDTRKADGEVQTLAKDGSRCPIVSLKYIPNSSRTSFPCAGLLTGTLEGASFWEQLNPDEYRYHNLQLEGSCTSVSFEHSTRHCLASFRPNKTHPSTRYMMCEMRRQVVGDHGNSLVSSNTVQTFYGGNTMKLLTQSALYPTPGEEGRLIVCAGDEASSSLYTWDGSTGRLKQKLPIGGTALDVCPFRVEGADYLASLTDKQIKLFKWMSR